MITTNKVTPKKAKKKNTDEKKDPLITTNKDRSKMSARHFPKDKLQKGKGMISTEDI